MALQEVLLIGSSGILAPHLIKSLSTCPQVSLTVLSRSQPKSPTQNAQFVSLPTPYKNEELAEVVKGKDAIINLVPPGQFDFHKNVIGLAVKAGVQRYVPPDFGLRSDNDELAKRTPIVAMKKRVREYLQTQEVKGLSWTSVICGAFLDSGLTGGFLGFNLEHRKARLYDDGSAKIDLTLLSDVATAVTTILERPEETKNRYVYVNTFLASQSDILSNLEKVYGKFEVSQIGALEACNQGTEKIKKGDFSGVKDSLMGALTSGVRDANGEGKDNGLLLGRSSRSIQDLEGVVRSQSKD